MRFLITAVGSAGDVHPFIAIGEALVARGHDVRVLAAPPFETRIVRAGLAFAALGTADDYERVVRRAELWEPLRGSRLVFDELLDHLPEAYATTNALAADDDVVLVGSTLAWGMRLVQERRGLVAATVHLSPAVLQSATAPALLPAPWPLRDPSWMPAPLLRALQSVADRLVLDRWLAPRLNAFRRTIDLPPVRRVVGRWMHSPDLVLCAWPDWFARPQADWPPRATTTGFPLFAESAATLPDSLSAFLDAGTRPVGITPGSAMAHGARFFEQALAAAAALGRRVVAVTPYRDALPASLPRSVHVVDYAPFGALLRRLAALVHHGGIGTSAQALAAGIPQVVAPFAHDQFDNAARLERLDVSRTVRRHERGADWLAALRSAVDEPAIRDAVADRARAMASSPPALARIADALEGLGTSGPRSRAAGGR